MVTKKIQNIFMDAESYKLIRDLITLDDLIKLIFDKVDTSLLTSTHISILPPIDIKGKVFEVQYRPKKLLLSYVFTMDWQYVDPYDNKFRKNLYLYIPGLLTSDEELIDSQELLLYTTKSTLIIGYDQPKTVTLR